MEEDGLEILESRAGARDAAGQIGDVVAVGVGAPDVEESGGGIGNSDSITAWRLLVCDCGPTGPHANSHRSATEIEFRSGAPACRVEEVRSEERREGKECGCWSYARRRRRR